MDGWNALGDALDHALVGALGTVNPNADRRARPSISHISSAPSSASPL
jgi:hypothetical protein